MSTLDDQVVDDTSEVQENPPQVNAQEGGPGYIILFFILGFATSLIVGWVVYPKLLYSQRQQPAAFNHALHNEEVENECESCHFFREDGSYAGVPKLEQCIECHDEVQGETEAEAIFVSEYVQKNREVPWLIYSRQPPCVFFSHAAHVLKAGMDCVECHGSIGESENLKVYQENRITGYSRDIWGSNIAGFKNNSWDRMKMNDCVECHRKNNVNQGSVQTEKGGCFVCHH
jgi:hypothetical protein